MKKIIFSIFLLVSCVVSATAQFGGGGPGQDVIIFFDGPSTAQATQIKTYTVSASSGSHTSTSYTVSGGTITSQSTSSVSVRWTSVGNSRWIRANPTVNGTQYSEMVYVNVSNPPAPAKPSTPSISSNTCGNKTLTRGNPPSGVTWYWQTSSGGTSTGNSSSTYTVTSTRTMYLRARNNTYGVWSSSASRYAPVNAYPSKPPTPSVSQSCGSTTMTRSSPPGGITYYWQTSSNGTSTSNSSSTYTATSSGTIYLRARNNSSGCWSSSRARSFTVNSTPPTPSAPSVSQSCGSTTLTRGSSPSGITWYWQTSSGGTSTSNSSSTYTSTSNTTVYLRARNNSTGCWSSSQSASISVNTVPPTPSAPSVSQSCGSTTLTRGSSPSGITWYWQISSNGTSTSNSSSTYSSTSNGTVYLRARNNSSGCWSSSRSASISVNTVPSKPSAPSISQSCGSTTLTRGTPPSGVTFYWQTSSNGTSTANSSSTYTSSSNGTVYLRARNNSSGCWSSSRSAGISVNTVPATPPVPSAAQSCGSTTLTRATPPSGVTYYWQTSVGGTSTSNSSGTYTSTSNGTVYLRARNNSSGCWSSDQSVSITTHTAPATPPAPTVAQTCGATTLTRGTPPSGITYYWQTSSSGTSVSNSSSTYTASEDGTVYLRAQNTSTGCWSASVTAAIVVNDGPAIPTMPSIDESCGSTTLTRATAPSGVTWYWQTSSGGTSTTEASTTYTLNQSGTVYLRGRDDTNNCWGSALEIIANVREVASVPTISGVAYTFEGAVVTRNNPPAGETWYWQSSASGTAETNSALTETTTGTVYLRSVNADNCWSSAVATTLAAQEPQNVAVGTVTPSEVTLNWTAAGNETGFNIYRSPSANGTYVQIGTAGSAATAYTDTGLAPETTYHYRIQAEVGGQQSAAQQVVVGTTSPVSFPINEGLSQASMHNGNISAIRWKGANDDEEQLYSFSYDSLNRLKSAQYAAKEGVNYTQNRGYFSVPDIGYDLNGNIQSLTRQGKNTNGYTDVIDELTYDYGAGIARSNQLMSVTDAKSDAGFSDGNKSGDDYVYDANGNMVKDRNKEIDTIYYNHLNLPILVDFETPGDSIEYLYDAAGIKLQQIVYDSGVQVKVTDYVGEFIYVTDTSGTRRVELIQHEEGRIIPEFSASQPELVEGYDYQYHLKDHLGNVRTTFSTKPENYTMIETFETGEENGWQDLHRYTSTSANTTVGGNEVERLQSGQTGAMIFINVNKGDTVNLSVNANYESAPTNNNFTGTAYSALFGSFDNVYGSGAENGISTTSTVFDDALGGLDMSGKGNASSAPRAFLNYIIFDKEMNYKTAGFQQISTSALGVGVHETISINDILPEQEGYVLAYLSNENLEAVNIHWDDFTVYHGKTNVVSTQDYYPFGLTFNESVRVASTINRFKYNSFEFMDGLNLNLYDYQARYFDPVIGRFINVDPAADLMRRHSPYNYAFDNPIRFIDPDGMMPEDAVDPTKAFSHTVGRGGSPILSSNRLNARELSGRGHIGNRSFVNQSKSFSTSSTGKIKSNGFGSKTQQAFVKLNGGSNLTESVSQTNTTVNVQFNEDMTEITVTTTSVTTEGITEAFSESGTNEYTETTSVSTQSFSVELSSDQGLFEVTGATGEATNSSSSRSLNKSEVSQEFSEAVEVEDARNLDKGVRAVKKLNDEGKKGFEEIISN